MTFCHVERGMERATLKCNAFVAVIVVIVVVRFPLQPVLTRFGVWRFALYLDAMWKF